MRATLLLLFIALAAGCVDEPATPAALAADEEAPATEHYRDFREGAWTVSLGGSGSIGGTGWPALAPPKNFASATATIAWTGALGAVEMRIVDGGEAIWQEILESSPATFELGSDDERVLGAEQFELRPVLGTAAARYEFTADFVYYFS